MSDFSSPLLSLEVLATTFQSQGSPSPGQSRFGDASLWGSRQRQWIYLRAGGHAWCKRSKHSQNCTVGLKRSVWRACVACGSMGDELCVSGSCESGCSGSGGMGACVELAPSRELPLPPSVSSPLLPKFGARAPDQGWSGCAPLGHLPLPPAAAPGMRSPYLPRHGASSSGGGSDSPRLGSGAGSIRPQLCPPPGRTRQKQLWDSSALVAAEAKLQHFGHLM